MTVKHLFRVRVLGVLAMASCSLVFAKLPDPSPQEAAKAAEGAARAAWAGRVDNYKLCISQDRAVAHYRKTTPDAKPATWVGAACTDPGPFAYTPPADKPLESAGAHSPPGTASSPPNTATPAAATGAAASAPKS